ncbi:MAG: DMT family transporter [Ruminococcaceae bacterium]|nr:DMT family transporter [Oscillospiraceae bacterium]
MNKTLEHALAFFTIAIWAITFITTKELQNTFSSLEILFIRYFIAYIALWFMCPKRIKFEWKTEKYFIAASICGASLYQYLENVSVEYTTPASVSFITALAPLFTAIFAHFILKEKLTKRMIIGMLISIAGVGLISFGDSKALETGLLGDVIIFCTVWLWAVYSILVKKIDDFGFPGFAVTRRIFFYALVVMIVPISLTADVSVSDFTVSSIANLLYLGVLASALCFYTWNRAVARLGTITASKYLFIMPIITFFAQLVYNKSVVGVASTIGMATILLGLFISEQKSGDVIEEK